MKEKWELIHRDVHLANEEWSGFLFKETKDFSDQGLSIEPIIRYYVFKQIANYSEEEKTV